MPAATATDAADELFPIRWIHTSFNQTMTLNGDTEFPDGPARITKSLDRERIARRHDAQFIQQAPGAGHLSFDQDAAIFTKCVSDVSVELAIDLHFCRFEIRNIAAVSLPSNKRVPAQA